MTIDNIKDQISTIHSKVIGISDELDAEIDGRNATTRDIIDVDLLDLDKSHLSVSDRPSVSSSNGYRSSLSFSKTNINTTIGFHKSIAFGDSYSVRHSSSQLPRDISELNGTLTLNGGERLVSKGTEWHSVHVEGVMSDGSKAILEIEISYTTSATISTSIEEVRILSGELDVSNGRINTSSPTAIQITERLINSRSTATYNKNHSATVNTAIIHTSFDKHVSTQFSLPNKHDTITSCDEASLHIGNTYSFTKVIDSESEQSKSSYSFHQGDTSESESEAGFYGSCLIAQHKASYSQYKERRDTYTAFAFNFSGEVGSLIQYQVRANRWSNYVLNYNTNNFLASSRIIHLFLTLYADKTCTKEFSVYINSGKIASLLGGYSKLYSRESKMLSGLQTATMKNPNAGTAGIYKCLMSAKMRTLSKENDLLTVV